ncbi:hypothetical protein [Kutzneria buriramensis]|uniref:Uncharacterized protein n=1 Tax=Kutzneria buriramensis TaxID=1045776 RepID=A0A3E0IAK7_9PSEU|nr:hypothetical protein [Kutzneria buriramensis]REH55175.1 hypothetical protein BCF44_101191 [Kutzneria buriramensis]
MSASLLVTVGTSLIIMGIAVVIGGPVASGAGRRRTRHSSGWLRLTAGALVVATLGAGVLDVFPQSGPAAYASPAPRKQRKPVDPRTWVHGDDYANGMTALYLLFDRDTGEFLKFGETRKGLDGRYHNGVTTFDQREGKDIPVAQRRETRLEAFAILVNSQAGAESIEQYLYDHLPGPYNNERSRGSQARQVTPPRAAEVNAVTGMGWRNPDGTPNPTKLDALLNAWHELAVKIAPEALDYYKNLPSRPQYGVASKNSQQRIAQIDDAIRKAENGTLIKPLPGRSDPAPTDPAGPHLGLPPNTDGDPPTPQNRVTQQLTAAQRAVGDELPLLPPDDVQPASIDFNDAQNNQAATVVKSWQLGDTGIFDSATPVSRAEITDSVHLTWDEWQGLLQRLFDEMVSGQSGEFGIAFNPGEGRFGTVQLLRGGPTGLTAPEGSYVVVHTHPYGYPHGDTISAGDVLYLRSTPFTHGYLMEHSSTDRTKPARIIEFDREGNTREVLSNEVITPQVLTGYAELGAKLPALRQASAGVRDALSVLGQRQEDGPTTAAEAQQIDYLLGLADNPELGLKSTGVKLDAQVAAVRAKLTQGAPLAAADRMTVQRYAIALGQQLRKQQSDVVAAQRGWPANMARAEAADAYLNWLVDRTPLPRYLDQAVQEDNAAATMGDAGAARVLGYHKTLGGYVDLAVRQAAAAMAPGPERERLLNLVNNKSGFNNLLRLARQSPDSLSAGEKQQLAALKPATRQWRNTVAAGDSATSTTAQGAQQKMNAPVGAIRTDQKVQSPQPEPAGQRQPAAQRQPADQSQQAEQSQPAAQEQTPLANTADPVGSAYAQGYQPAQVTPEQAAQRQADEIAYQLRQRVRAAIEQSQSQAQRIAVDNAGGSHVDTPATGAPTSAEPMDTTAILDKADPGLRDLAAKLVTTGATTDAVDAVADQVAKLLTQHVDPSLIGQEVDGIVQSTVRNGVQDIGASGGTDQSTVRTQLDQLDQRIASTPKDDPNLPALVDQAYALGQQLYGTAPGQPVQQDRTPQTSTRSGTDPVASAYARGYTGPANAADTGTAATTTPDQSTQVDSLHSGITDDTTSYPPYDHGYTGTTNTGSANQPNTDQAGTDASASGSVNVRTNEFGDQGVQGDIKQPASTVDPAGTGGEITPADQGGGELGLPGEHNVSVPRYEGDPGFVESAGEGLNGIGESLGAMAAQSIIQGNNDPQNPWTDKQITTNGGIDPAVQAQARAQAVDPTAYANAVREMNLLVAGADDPNFASGIADKSTGDNSGVTDTAVVRQLATNPQTADQLAGNPQAVDFARSCLTAGSAAAADSCAGQWQDSYQRQAYVDQLAMDYYYNGGGNANGNTNWNFQIAPGTAPVLDYAQGSTNQQAKVDALQSRDLILFNQTHAPVLESSVDPSVRADALALAQQMRQDQALLRAWGDTFGITAADRQAAVDNPALGEQMARNLKLGLVDNGVDPNLLTPAAHDQAAAQYQGSLSAASLYANTGAKVMSTFTADPNQSWDQNYTALVNQMQNQTLTAINGGMSAVRMAAKNGYRITPAANTASDFVTGLDGNNTLRATDVQNRIIAGLQTSLSGGNQTDFANYANSVATQAAAKQLQAEGYHIVLSPDGKSYAVYGNQATVNYVKSQFTTIGAKAALDALKNKQNQFEQNYLTALAQLPPLPGENRDDYVKRIHTAATAMTFQGKKVTDYQPSPQTVRLMDKNSNGATGTFGTADLGTVQHDLACSQAASSGHDNAYCAAHPAQPSMSKQASAQRSYALCVKNAGPSACASLNPSAKQTTDTGPVTGQKTYLAAECVKTSTKSCWGLNSGTPQSRPVAGSTSKQAAAQQTYALCTKNASAGECGSLNPNKKQSVTTKQTTRTTEPQPSKPTTATPTRSTTKQSTRATEPQPNKPPTRQTTRATEPVPPKPQPNKPGTITQTRSTTKQTTHATEPASPAAPKPNLSAAQKRLVSLNS